MMIAALLMIVQATASPLDGVPIAALPEQTLPKSGCAAYLFVPGEKRVFVGVAGADPALLRVSLGGTVTDLPRVAQRGAGAFGLAGSTDYAAGDVRAALDMSIETRADLKDGAVVKDATLRIDRGGQDGVVLPITGIVACAR